MQLAPMTNDNRRWDEYRAFHWNVARGFVQFETGELIYTISKPDPDQRRIFRDLDVQIVATGDKDCPRFVTPEGEKVASAWLNRKGQSYLAVDLTTGRAVQLGGHITYGRAKPDARDEQAPFYLQGRFTAYWAGPGRNPVGKPIDYAPPMKYEGEERQRLDNLKAQCEAWCALMGIEPKRYSRTEKIDGESVWVRQCQVMPKGMVNRSFTDLQMNERIELAEHGYSSELKVLTSDYLKVA